MVEGVVYVVGVEVCVVGDVVFVGKVGDDFVLDVVCG